MDIKANEKLSNLLEQMKKESLVKGIEDLQVGDVVYYDMDWQAEQYLIRQVDYPEFLEYDSWIDCTDQHTRRVYGIDKFDVTSLS